MSPRTKTETTKRLATGIYQTWCGYRVFYRNHGRLLSRRFGPEKSLADLKAWRAAQIARKTKAHRERGTLVDDAARYLTTVAAMPSIKERQRDLDAWVAVLGHRARASIRPEEIRAQLHAWKMRGGPRGRPLAASTINHRRTALSHLYTVLDGKSSDNPVRDIPTFREPRASKRFASPEVLERVFAKMGDGVVRARLLVLSWTGLRPSELLRLRPEDVDLERRIVWVQKPSKDGEPGPRALSEPACDAWLDFIAKNAWGQPGNPGAPHPWWPANARRTLHKACDAAGVPRMRVYDLRHSVGRGLRVSGADLADIQDQLGHADIRTTRIYADTVVEKLRVAADQYADSRLEARRTLKRETTSD